MTRSTIQPSYPDHNPSESIIAQERGVAIDGDVSGVVVTTGDVAGDLHIEHVFRPEIPAPPEPDRPPEMPHFAGRQAEITDITARLHAQGVVVVTGMAGVGKSALAAALGRQGWEPSKVFWHSFHREEGIEALIWTLAAFLAHHGQDHVWHMVQSTRQTSGQSQPTEVLCDYLRQTLRGQGFLICLDDFHWVEDEPLFQALLELFAQAAEAREIALLVTTRTMPTSVQPDALVPLAGLSLKDTQALLASYGITLAPESVAQLQAATEGNAQFLILSINALRRASNPERVITRLVEIDDIERYLLHEVDERLTEEERAVMMGVAVLLGYAGSRDAIEALMGQKRLWRTLRELADRHLLIVRETEQDELYSQHVVVQAFYYDMLSKRERVAMHQVAGAFYETEEPDPVRAARHFVYASDHGRAAQLVTADVDALLNRGEARALRVLLERLVLQTLNPEQKLAVMLTRGEVYTLLGESEMARANYEQALEQVATMEDPSARRVAKGRIFHGMGVLLERQSPPEALTWLRRGLAEVEGSGTLEEGILYLRIGSALVATGEYTSAQKALAQSLALVPDGTIHWRGRVLQALGVLACAQGQLDTGKGYYRQAMTFYQQGYNYWGLMGLWTNLGIEMDIAGEWVGAEGEYKRALAMAEHLGSALHQAIIALSYGNLSAKQGNISEAQAMLGRSLGLAQRHQLTEIQVAASSSLADLALLLEDLETAERLWKEAEQLAQQGELTYQLPEIYRGRALLQFARQDIPGALKLVAEALRLAQTLDATTDVGVSLRVRAQIEQAEDQLEAALNDFAESLRILQARDPHEAARTKLLWAQALMAQERTSDQASILLAEATEMYRALSTRV